MVKLVGDATSWRYMVLTGPVAVTSAVTSRFISTTRRTRSLLRFPIHLINEAADICELINHVNTHANMHRFQEISHQNVGDLDLTFQGHQIQDGR